jgi:hypothetical protein
MGTKVIRYLIAHYGITEIAAINLVSQAQEAIEDAEHHNSKPHYVGDQLASKAGLTHKEPCPAGECGASNA